MVKMSAEEFISRRLELGLLTRQKAADEIGVSYWAVKAWERKVSPVPSYAIRALDRYEQSLAKAKKTKGQNR